MSLVSGKVGDLLGSSLSAPPEHVFAEALRSVIAVLSTDKTKALHFTVG